MATVTINVSDKDNKTLKNIRVIEDMNTSNDIGHEIGTTDKDGNIKWETQTGKYKVILFDSKS